MESVRVAQFNSGCHLKEIGACPIDNTIAEIDGENYFRDKSNESLPLTFEEAQIIATSNDLQSAGDIDISSEQERSGMIENRLFLCRGNKNEACICNGLVHILVYKKE